MDELRIYQTLLIWVKHNPLDDLHGDTHSLRVLLVSRLRDDEILRNMAFPFERALCYRDEQQLKGALIFLEVYIRTRVMLTGYEARRTPIIHRVLNEIREKKGLDFVLDGALAVD